MAGTYKDVAGNEGWQYRADRAAQSFTPLRAADSFALRHPVFDALAYVVLAVGLGLLVGTSTHSVVIGLVVGAASTAFAAVTARRNHHRRLANGTSAEFGPPS